MQNTFIFLLIIYSVVYEYFPMRMASGVSPICSSNCFKSEMNQQANNFRVSKVYINFCFEINNFYLILFLYVLATFLTFLLFLLEDLNTLFSCKSCRSSLLRQMEAHVFKQLRLQRNCSLRLSR